MSNKMTPYESWANRLAMLAISEPCSKDRDALLAADSILRKIAAGEYKQVVHAHIFGKGYDLHCSNCGVSADIGKNYCHFCGAVFDGKDDSR